LLRSKLINVRSRIDLQPSTTCRETILSNPRLCTKPDLKSGKAPDSLSGRHTGEHVLRMPPSAPGI
jgi:hypothetical protein